LIAAAESEKGAAMWQLADATLPSDGRTAELAAFAPSAGPGGDGPRDGDGKHKDAQASDPSGDPTGDDPTPEPTINPTGRGPVDGGGGSHPPRQNPPDDD